MKKFGLLKIYFIIYAFCIFVYFKKNINKKWLET